MKRYKVQKQGTIVAHIVGDDFTEMWDIQTKYKVAYEAAFRLQNAIKENHFSEEIDVYLDRYFIDLEARFVGEIVPYYRKYNLPYSYGFRCQLNWGGEFYIAHHTVPEQFQYLIERGAEKMKNIHDNKPVDGTIIGTLTEEELQTIIDMNAVVTALGNIQVTTSSLVEFKSFLEEYKKMEQKRLDFWVPVCRRLGVPMEWDIRADFATGDIFVVNYDKPYDEEARRVSFTSSY
jgi:hypothetical protein